MHKFEHQDSPQTLAEGIAEYHAANPGLSQARDMSAAAGEFFRCHDAVHVVFGCRNTLNDEAVVKWSSMLGTTAGLGVLRGYTLHESLDIYRKLRLFDVLVAILQSVVISPPIVFRCLRQSRKWPWSEFEPYMHVPLCQIRREFGISVARGKSAL